MRRYIPIHKSDMRKIWRGVKRPFIDKRGNPVDFYHGDRILGGGEGGSDFSADKMQGGFFTSSPDTAAEYGHLGDKRNSNGAGVVIRAHIPSRNPVDFSSKRTPTKGVPDYLTTEWRAYAEAGGFPEFGRYRASSSDDAFLRRVRDWVGDDPTGSGWPANRIAEHAVWAGHDSIVYPKNWRRDGRRVIQPIYRSGSTEREFGPTALEFVEKIRDPARIKQVSATYQDNLKRGLLKSDSRFRRMLKLARGVKAVKPSFWISPHRVSPPNLDDLHPENLRIIQDRMGRHGWTRHPIPLMRSIREEGRDRFDAWNGSHRVMAAINLGRKRIPVISGNRGREFVAISTYDDISTGNIRRHPHYKKRRRDFVTDQRINEALDMLKLSKAGHPYRWRLTYSKMLRKAAEIPPGRPVGVAVFGVGRVSIGLHRIHADTREKRRGIPAAFVRIVHLGKMES